jgi:hypothetical protein
MVSPANNFRPNRADNNYLLFILINVDLVRFEKQLTSRSDSAVAGVSRCFGGPAIRRLATQPSIPQNRKVFI